MTMLNVTELSRKFNNVKALGGVSFTVEGGEIFALLGPSASGKTTTLRAISGDETLDSGRVVFDGVDVTRTPAQGRGMATVFQDFALDPRLTVYENLAHPLRADGFDGPAVCNRVGEVADVLDLNQALTRDPGTIGASERQRVAVGRELVRRPRLLLLDAPPADPDATTRHSTRAEFKRRHRELGTTVLYATSDQTDALAMADRVAVMRDGAVEQIGTPHEIFARPKNLFVAGFIGTPRMNLLESKLIGFEAGRGRFALAGQVVELEVDAAVVSLAAGSAVTIGIRPRAFEVTSELGPDSLAGQVHRIEPMGGEALVHLLAAGLDIRTVVPRDLDLLPGERVHLRCRPRQAQVFDDRGERVSS